MEQNGNLKIKAISRLLVVSCLIHTSAIVSYLYLILITDVYLFIIHSTRINCKFTHARTNDQTNKTKTKIQKYIEL